MNRKQQLLEIISRFTDDEILFTQLIDEIIYIEGQLDDLKKYPFINVNPKNQLQQKATAAAKLYKEFLQQYNNCLKTLAKATGQDSDDEDSPLRQWIRNRMKQG